jgi:hypothetical protein
LNNHPFIDILLEYSREPYIIPFFLCGMTFMAGEAPITPCGKKRGSALKALWAGVVMVIGFFYRNIMNGSQNFSSRLRTTPYSIPVRFIALFIVSVTLPLYGANGTAYYFDVNGTTSGFGSPSGSYNLNTGTNWSTSSAGTAATVTLPSNSQMTFGNSSSDFPSATFTISLDRTFHLCPWSGLLINSNSANITMNGAENTSFP